MTSRCLQFAPMETSTNWSMISSFESGELHLEVRKLPSSGENSEVLAWSSSCVTEECSDKLAWKRGSACFSRGVKAVKSCQLVPACCPAAPAAGFGSSPRVLGAGLPNSELTLHLHRLV